MPFYQFHESFTIRSDWDSDDLKGIVVLSNDEIWECRVCDLQAPVGMDPITFFNLLKHTFLNDASGMNIIKSGNQLLIDCNQSADGFTFTFASFKLEKSTGLSFLSFCQKAIMDLVIENNQKSKYITELDLKIKSVEQVNAELEKELNSATQIHMRDSVALTTVFKRIVNSKKSKIRALQERTSESS